MSERIAYYNIGSEYAVKIDCQFLQETKFEKHSRTESTACLLEDLIGLKISNNG